VGEGLIAGMLALRWQGEHRDPDDTEWFGFVAFLVLLPVMLAILMPYLLWVGLKDNHVPPLGAWSVAGLATTLTLGVGLLFGLWWVILPAAAFGAVGWALINWAATAPAKEKDETEPDYYLHS
jgi:hypothetical protein